MNISLSDDLKEFVEAQVAEGSYSSTSEYLRQLIREKRDEARFTALLLEGANSPLSEHSTSEILSVARARIAKARESAAHAS